VTRLNFVNDDVKITRIKKNIWCWSGSCSRSNLKCVEEGNKSLEIVGKSSSEITDVKE
jgi:hypothetical protein